MNTSAENDSSGFNDTPIKKIVIRTTPRSEAVHPHQSHSHHSSGRGRKIENEPMLIRVLKKPTHKSTSVTHPKKYNSTIHTSPSENNPIYYARAKVNGSFRHSPIKSIDSKQSRSLRRRPTKMRPSN